VGEASPLQQDQAKQKEEAVGTKKCNGHHCQGQLRPLAEFYVHGSGVRKGRPFSRCKRCWNYQRTHAVVGPEWLDYVPMLDFRIVAVELIRRIGPTQAARRMGVNPIIFTPKRLALYESVRRRTYDSAVRVLADARAHGEDGWDALAVKTANLTDKRRVEAGRRSGEVRRRRRDERIALMARVAEQDRLRKLKRPSVRPAKPIRQPWTETEREQDRQDERYERAADMLTDMFMAESDWAKPDKNGTLCRFADFECEHNRLPGDKTPPCGCWPQER
jgi:hypothetical protein